MNDVNTENEIQHSSPAPTIATALPLTILPPIHVLAGSVTKDLEQNRAHVVRLSGILGQKACACIEKDSLRFRYRPNSEDRAVDAPAL